MFKIGTLIWDDEDEEWGIIAAYLGDGRYDTLWTKSKNQVLNEDDFDQDRFETYEV